MNKNEIPLFTDKSKISISFAGKDDLFAIKKYYIYINGVPVNGIGGISLDGNEHKFYKEQELLLTPGSNTIQVSCINLNGIESNKEEVTITYSSSTPSPSKTYFIGIGANHFADSRYNLQYSAKDIRDLAGKLKERYGDSIVIDTFFDEQINTTNILALKKKLLHTTVNDKVIISYSGHGMLSSDYDYYLSTWNINFSNPQEGGLPYDALESLLDSIPARQKLLLIDACNSGEVDKEELARMRQHEVRQENNGVAVKGLKIYTDSNIKLGTKNTFELMQNLFVNVSRNTGATVISAAAGTQYAIEKDGNGVFTHSILEYMQQHDHAKVSELKQYVNQRVVELTNGMQAPTAREENLEYDWQVW